MLRSVPGVRIQYLDPKANGATVLIEHAGDPKTGRAKKDYHLRLDGEGRVIVSTTILRRLQEAHAPILILNEVADPPAQKFGSMFVDDRQKMREIDGALRTLAPPGTYGRVSQEIPHAGNRPLG